MLRFDADASLIIAQAGSENEPARIAGIAVPWDVVATVSDGQQVRFARGAFNTAQKPAKLIENHDGRSCAAWLTRWSMAMLALSSRPRWQTPAPAETPWRFSRPVPTTP